MSVMYYWISKKSDPVNKILFNLDSSCTRSHITLHVCAKSLHFWWRKIGVFCVQKLTKFKVIFDLFTVCVYFIQQQNCKLFYIYLMNISETQSKTEHYSCDSAKFKATADFSHHAKLFLTLSLKSDFCTFSWLFDTHGIYIEHIICRVLTNRGDN